MSLLVIVDLDGTLCDNRHRANLIPARKDLYDNWHDFNMACHMDTPIQYRINMILLLEDMGAEIVYLTSRSEEARSNTSRWLNQHGAPAGDLYMRQPGDHRLSAEYKAEMIAKITSSRGVKKFAVLDDDHRICEHVMLRYPQAVVVKVPSLDCAYLSRPEVGLYVRVPD